jgi:hypothetical protein
MPIEDIFPGAGCYLIATNIGCKKGTEGTEGGNLERFCRRQVRLRKGKLICYQERSSFRPEILNPIKKVHLTGLELSQKILENMQIPLRNGAESGAVKGDSTQIDLT